MQKYPTRTLVVSRSGLDQKRNGTNTYKPNGESDDVAEHMLLNFSESGHSVFRGTSVSERGTLKSKRGGKWSVHFCGDPQTVEVIFRTIISVNQLNADMCEELASRISDCSASTVRPVAKDAPETLVAPTELSTTTNPLLTNDQARGNLLQEYKQRFAHLPDDLRMIKLCSVAVFMKTVFRGQYFVTIDEAELARDVELSKAKGWIRGNTKIGPVTVGNHQGRYGIEIRY